MAAGFFHCADLVTTLHAMQVCLACMHEMCRAQKMERPVAQPSTPRTSWTLHQGFSQMRQDQHAPRGQMRQAPQASSARGSTTNRFRRSQAGAAALQSLRALGTAQRTGTCKSSGAMQRTKKMGVHQTALPRKKCALASGLPYSICETAQVL